MIKIALSHDIDRTKKTYQFFTKPIRTLFNGNFKHFKELLATSFRRGNYWTFDDIIEIEKSFNIKSTFFFLNESINFNVFEPKSFVLSHGRYNIHEPKIVNLIRWLDNNGWEVGLHGSYNSFQNLELLKNEKAELEGILGHSIDGIRQHYLNLNKDTWHNHFVAGFKYDSSFGYTREIGFKEGRYQPFKPLDDEFIVVPLVVMDACFMSLPNRWERIDELMDICEKENAILVVNFHNHVFNNNEFPGFRDAYIRIIEKGIERNGDFQTISAHLQHMNIANKNMSLIRE